MSGFWLRLNVRLPVAGHLSTLYAFHSGRRAEGGRQ